MYPKHAALVTPPPSTAIWRYQDLGKLLSMIERGALFSTSGTPSGRTSARSTAPTRASDSSMRMRSGSEKWWDLWWDCTEALQPPQFGTRPSRVTVYLT